MSVKLSPYKIIESIITEQGLKFEKEFRFSTKRRWRFDYRIIDPERLELKLAVEINGSAFTQGRHTRGVGYGNDLEKINAAQSLGWKVLQYTTGQVINEPARIARDIKYIVKRENYDL